MIGEIQYGDIKLRMTWCDVTRRPILSTDGTTLLYQETTVEVMAIYNPAATAYSAPVGGGRVPVASNRAFAGETDVSLREYLAQPQRLLLIHYGDETGGTQKFLESPPIRKNRRLPSDAKNGPICTVNSIKDHFGTKTYQCWLVFKTWVVCPDLAAKSSRLSPTPIIAHRLSKTVDIDQDYNTIIHTRGEVVFDVGRLWATNTSPDFWRSEFFAAPPGNFARSHINVAVSEDNTTASYTVIDQQRTFNLGTRTPATRVECFLTTDYQQGSVPLMQAQIAENAIFGLANAIQGLSIDPVHDAALVLGFGVNHALSYYRALNSQMPRYYAAIKFRCWGASNSSRLELFDLCMAIAIAKMGAMPDFLTSAASTQFTVTQEITGKYVELDWIIRYTDEALVRLAARITGTLFPNGIGRAPTLAQLRRLVTNGLPDVLNGAAGIFANIGNAGTAFYMPYLRAAEDVAFPAASNNKFTQDGVGNRSPMGNTDNLDRYARGAGYVEKLMVQGLSGQCENPPIVGFQNAAPST